MKDTSQVRVNVPHEDAMLLKWLNEKNIKKPMGQILIEYLYESPRWMSLKQQLKDFRDTIEST